MKSDVNISCVEAGASDHASEKHESPTPTPQADPVVKAWPTQPKELVLSSQDRLFYAAYDIALLALPILLMIKTGLCIFAYHYDRDSVGQYIDSASFMSRTLINFNSQLVTLFTIVFVTIVSTCVKRFALWKAQRGAYITDLEQYQGSISLPSTLKLVWSLRSFKLRSVLLVLAWSFYYLGSQAVKLEYELSLSGRYHKMRGAVLRSDAPSYFNSDPATVYDDTTNGQADTSTTMPGRDLDRLNTYFQSVILEIEGGGGKSDAVTNPGYRNGPLVPVYSSAVANAKESIADKVRRKRGGWIETSQRSKQSYTSDTGTALSLAELDTFEGIHSWSVDYKSLLGTYTLYNISSLQVDCDSMTILPLSSFPNNTDSETALSLNATTANDTTLRDMNGYPLHQITYSYRGWYKNPPNDTDPAQVSCPPFWDDTYTYSERAAQLTCNMTTKYVDLQVSCVATGCYPQRVRWANNTDESTATSHYSPIDDDILSNFIHSTGPPLQKYAQTMVAYEYARSSFLNDSYWSTYGPTDNQANYQPALRQARLDSISFGLTKGLNTYFKLSQIIVSEKTSPDFNRLIGNITASNPHPRDTFYQLVDAKGAPYEPAYRINWIWVVIDFLSCTVLLAAAIASYWLRVHTLAPDIFGFVSSLTRGNPHIQLPSEGSTLGGIERARMLKGVKVKLGNVQEVSAENGPVGTVGLAPVQAAGVQPLRPAQVYQ